MRITAGRLRNALTRYYETEEAQDPIYISIPKGTYVPVFGFVKAKNGNLSGMAPRRTTGSYELTLPQGPAIVVLPFNYPANQPELLYLANGLAEQLVIALNCFPEYLVIGPLSRTKLADGRPGPRAMGREYKAQFVLSGTLRGQGERIRATIKLMDTVTGGVIWSDRYDGYEVTADLFAFEDWVASQITATIGDNLGIIPRLLTQKAMTKGVKETAVYDAILRYYHYVTVYTEESHTAAFEALERAGQLAPDDSLILAMRADIIFLEYQLFDADKAVLEQVKELARRALAIDPLCQHAHFALANIYFAQGERTLFTQKLEQVVALNPNNAHLLYAGSLYLTIIGEWERGAAWLKKAERLNPHFPSWIYLVAYLKAYLQGNYAEALVNAERIDAPGVYVPAMLRAAVLGQLGRVKEGETAVSELLALYPDFPQRGRELMRRLFFSTENVQALAVGLAKVGLRLL